MTNHKRQGTNHEPRGTNHEKGMILLVVLMVMVVISIYLPAYVTWTIWDQKNLIRQQTVEDAKTLAQAGLNRAILDLQLEGDSWINGEINGHAITPDSNNPDQFQTLYNQVSLGNGNYTVGIDFLQNPSTCTSGCSFFERKVLVRSTGTITQTGESVSLEEYVYRYIVKNIGQDPDNPADDRLFYASLQPAVNDIINNGWTNDTIAITAGTLTENVTISSATFSIKGCYDPEFTFRSCNDYRSMIRGDVNITGTADVNIGGVTIQ